MVEAGFGRARFALRSSTLVGSHFLHLVAMVGLRTLGRGPFGVDRTLRLVRRLGRRLSPVDREQARTVATQLRAGTCLTRAMTVSARWPGSVVVVGVRSGKAVPQGFGAHAWVERDGIALRPQDPDGAVIARFA